MRQSVRVSRSADVVTIAITGRFDFNCHQDFRKSYEGLARSDRLTIDLADTEYMDSSALGMLLILRDSVETVRLANPRPGVRKILDIAHFGSLFEIT